MVVLIALTYTRLPWRPLQPKPTDTHDADGQAVTAAPALDTSATPGSAETPRPTTAPDAYADST